MFLVLANFLWALILLVAAAVLLILASRTLPLKGQIAVGAAGVLVAGALGLAVMGQYWLDRDLSDRRDAPFNLDKLVSSRSATDLRAKEICRSAMAQIKQLSDFAGPDGRFVFDGLHYSFESATAPGSRSGPGRIYISRCRALAVYRLFRGDSCENVYFEMTLDPWELNRVYYKVHEAGELREAPLFDSVVAKASERNR